MINQQSNNKPSGQQGVECDAGIPIMGRTASNVYQIVQVDADGKLEVTGGGGGGGIVVPLTSGFTYQPEQVTLPAAAYIGGTVLVYNGLPTGGFTVNVTQPGIYNIRPFFMFRASVNGTINLILIRKGSACDTYTSGRNVGADGYTPLISESIGQVAFWTAVPTLRASGGQVYKTQFNPSTLPEFNYYLGIGEYKLCIVTNTATTTNDATLLYGFETFYKIG
jgi:hypothetical protein